MNIQEIILCVACATIVALSLILLYYKKLLNETTISAASELIKTLSAATDENTLTSRLLKYCSTAVDAVQQMVRNGQLPQEDEVRKRAAIEIVKTYAVVDGIEVTDEIEEALPTMIESEVLWTNHSEQR